jgi:hypothetical protein
MNQRMEQPRQGRKILLRGRVHILGRRVGQGPNCDFHQLSGFPEKYKKNEKKLEMD